MKKIIVVIGLLFSLVGFGQDFGKYKVQNYKIAIKGVECENNQWYEFSIGGGFFKNYNKTPIGIKKAIFDIDMILYENKIKFEDCSDSSYLSSLVNGIYDYEMLNITIQNESSEVLKIWDIDRKQMLMLSLKKNEYVLSIIKL